MGHQSVTIVFTHGGGRFGNQLTAFGHLIGWAKENPGIGVVSVPFWPYAGDCRGTRGNSLCRYPLQTRLPAGLVAPLVACRVLKNALPARLRRSLSYRLPRLSHRLFPSRSFDRDYAPKEEWLGDPEFLARVRSRKISLLAGYVFRDWEAFGRQQDEIRRFLFPVGSFDGVSPLICELRQKHTLLVGILIRKTDYREWMGGRFFFEDARYRAWIEQMRSRFGPDTAFVLCSDEPLTPSAFHGLNCFASTGKHAGKGSYLDAMLVLSQCDVIASVPSTFSGWASFFGKKPILPLTSADDDAGRIALIEDHLIGASKHPTFRLAVA